MRFSHYFLRSPVTGIHKMRFEATHFRAKGFNYMSVGVPALEAFELINEMNRKANGYTYWLETL